jgi:monoamine oxidase
MGRSLLFDQISRAMRIAFYCEKNNLTTSEGLERAREADAIRRSGRREFIANMGRLAAVGAVATIAEPIVSAFGVSVGIVGAGLAGLSCGDVLKSNGINATLYDATTRVGGRCYSLSNFFPGQVAERGGEFIDNLHKTMLGYAKRFNLAIEDVNKQPGELLYYFQGQYFSESVIVDQFRDFVSAMHADLRAISGDVTADNHTDVDVRLDRTNLLEYLEGRNGAGIAAAPVIKEAIIQSYIAEYGLAAEEQSCLNFLLFIHADKRSKFTPFGIYSDERYHVIDGNDRIAQGLANSLPNQIEFEMRLVRVRKTSAGRVELTFKRGNQTLTRIHDTVVFAIPFTVLRGVELDPNLGLPAEKLNAINLLGYGTNAKMMVGFSSRPWELIGGNGSSYSDLPNVQTTWQTNPTKGTSSRGIITDYSSAQRGAQLNPKNVQTEAAKFLTDLDRVFPGALAAASRNNDQFVVHLEHWPSNPLTQGSYTCYTPGQFTSIAGIEGKQVANLHFAGEHADSFYSWQGFMEGAALSGIRAASEILQDIKVGNL